MGCKNIKEHYKVEHLVRLCPKGVLIGSGFLPEMIVVGLDGMVTSRRDSSNADISRVYDEIAASPEKFAELFAKPDVFEKSIPVFTHEEGVVIEKQCEALGWPNLTHDGYMMFDNTHSASKEQVVEWAKESAKIAVRHSTEYLEKLKVQLADCEADVAKYRMQQDALNREYPAPIDSATTP